MHMPSQCSHEKGKRPVTSANGRNPVSRYLSWQEYFMAVAVLSAQRSKDPNKQVGACIVGRNHVILGIGYNGFPRGCDDRQLPWAKKSLAGALGTKYPYVVRLLFCKCTQGTSCHWAHQWCQC